MLTTKEDVIREFKKALNVYSRLIQEATQSSEECIVSIFTVKKDTDIIGIFAMKADPCYRPLPLTGPEGNGTGYNYYCLSQKFFHNSGKNADCANLEDEIHYMIQKGTGEWDHKEYLAHLDRMLSSDNMERTGRSMDKLLEDNLIETLEEVLRQLEGGYIDEIMRPFPFT